ncbi:signal recognition particle protein [Acidaminobacter hydrogenoformans]|uniref:Signal recognition particle protein n=1 Tax=Acidaminobacter hydrogenoformans DSM 2784 TaxID=1120920 RepID=A0A1G5RS68_9FIRM|nr:signal recognition particle protein [Acidaminobacter hydrogenoformans]SCZ76904.1 signal recognition particle subunit FFH/SRP54 (srp54) [Acidaminobacter hydrogenoformans DSM 2784]
MVFESLADKLQNTFKTLRGKGKLTEADVKAAMREVKLALLEADVNFKIVKDFIQKVTDRAIGQEVMSSLTPGQQVIKIVNEELTTLMGTTRSKLTFSSSPISVYMMVGLQGSGKTTTCGKLGNYLKKQGKKPLLVACDIYRPAAIKQLQVVGDSLAIPVFTMGEISPIEITKAAITHAQRYGNDVVILDTAGRLHIDEMLMNELVDIKKAARPTEILLVVDAMTGQDAVNVAESFNAQLGIDGLIMTKLDGDTRGGAALSVRAVTGKPIKFAGVGEKLSELEEFHPDRMASRILGMGDVLTLIEKAQSTFDEDEARKLEKKMKKGSFDFEDFLSQLQQMKKMGPIGDLLGMIPGLGNQKALKDIQVDEKDFVRLEAIIQSMTLKERRDPNIINGSRKKRIAAGSGTSVQEVNKLLKQFEQTKKMMKQFAGMDKRMKRGGMRMPF